jgi:hypothetical protein
VPAFEGCRLNDVKFELDSTAMNTFSFLKMLVDRKFIAGI